MRTVIACTLMSWLVCSTAARAQSSTPPAPTPARPSPAVQALKKRVAAQQKQLEDQRKKLDVLVKAQAERDKQAKKVAKQVKHIQEAREAEQLKKLGEAGQRRFKPSFRLFGFADFNFIKRMNTGHNKIGRLIVTEPASFYMLSANVYALSRVTRNLSTLMEIRFTYQPHGDPKENEVYLDNGSQRTLVEGTRFVRENTVMHSPVDTTKSRRGGLVIERLHFDYRVADWLKFRVGRFLTPYGIWNIDHGSPVVIPASVPFMQRLQFMPSAQTGIHVSGRFFFTDQLHLDYAITVSNGRGPLDEVADVDDHFAYGLRLRLVYEGAKVKFALGAYGYYGRLHDKKKDIVIDLVANEALTYFDTIEEQDELIVSADLLVELFGLRLQAEYVYAYHKYLSPTRGDTTSTFQAVTNVGGGVMPTYYAHDAYVLLAYTLPLKKYLGAMKVTPFASYEFCQLYDFAGTSTIFTAGVNFRPLPALVFKVQWEGLLSDRLGNFNMVIAQMAVAF